MKRHKMSADPNSAVEAHCHNKNRLEDKMPGKDGSGPQGSGPRRKNSGGCKTGRSGKGMGGGRGQGQRRSPDKGTSGGRQGTTNNNRGQRQSEND